MLNLCRLASTTVVGAGGNAYDGDLATYWGRSANEPPGGTQTFSVSGSWTFAASHYVKKCGWKISIAGGSSAGASYNGWSASGYFRITAGGSYVYLLNWSSSGTGNSSGYCTDYGNYVTSTTGWADVSKAEVHAEGVAQRGCGGAEGGSEWALGNFYEVEVWVDEVGYACVI